MRSIRGYLLTRLLSGAALVSLLAGLAVFFVTTRSIEAQFDRNLADRIQGFASILFQAGNEVSFEFSEELMPGYEPAPQADFFQVLFEGGGELELSNSLLHVDEVLDLPQPATSEVVFWTAPLPDGRPGRYATQLIEVHHVYPEEGPNRPTAARVEITVARGREPLTAYVRRILLGAFVGALAELALLAILIHQAVTRGLASTHLIAERVEQLDLDRLPEVFKIDTVPVELLPVTSKVEALVQRVDVALKRERRTTADIAHELRTPISEVLTASEVALRNPDLEPEARMTLLTTRDVAWNMARSISTLLKLARLQARSEPFHSESVNLTEVVEESLRSYAAVARDRGIQVESVLLDEEQVIADAGVLAIIVSNLIGNALQHGETGDIVHLSLQRPSGHWRFVVANGSGPLAGSDLESLSRPFWRKDSARTDRSRSGLGLTLSSNLADCSGLALEFELEGETFRAVLTGALGSAA